VWLARPNNYNLEIAMIEAPVFAPIDGDVASTDN
jgi:hypothetical protein